LRPKLARRRGWVIDGEVLTVAALLHDVGLYPSVSRGGVYTADGAAAAHATADLPAALSGGVAVAPFRAVAPPRPRRGATAPALPRPRGATAPLPGWPASQ
jgi:hypothetical protein